LIGSRRSTLTSRSEHVASRRKKEGQCDGIGASLGFKRLGTGSKGFPAIAVTRPD